MWGDTSEAERVQALRDLRDGRVAVVFAVDLFNEGVDVPSVDTLLMLRPTKSATLFLQQLGRGLRRDVESGKALCTVLDFVEIEAGRFEFIFVPDSAAAEPLPQPGCGSGGCSSCSG